MATSLNSSKMRNIQVSDLCSALNLRRRSCQRVVSVHSTRVTSRTLVAAKTVLKTFVTTGKTFCVPMGSIRKLELPTQTRSTIVSLAERVLFAVPRLQLLLVLMVTIVKRWLLTFTQNQDSLVSCLSEMVQVLTTIFQLAQVDTAKELHGLEI